MNRPKIRVLIVDHGSVSRNSLIRQLEINNNIEVVGQAVHREQAATLVQKMAPQLLLLTLGAPGPENVETVETIMDLRNSYHGDALLFRCAVGCGIHHAWSAGRGEQPG